MTAASLREIGFGTVVSDMALDFNQSLKCQFLRKHRPDVN